MSFLDDDKKNRLLLDYGIAPTDPPKYPLPSPSVKHSIITHSHIDHLEWHLGCVQITGLNFMAHQLQQIYQN